MPLVHWQEVEHRPAHQTRKDPQLGRSTRPWSHLNVVTFLLCFLILHVSKNTLIVTFHYSLMVSAIDPSIIHVILLTLGFRLTNAPLDSFIVASVCIMENKHLFLCFLSLGSIHHRCTLTWKQQQDNWCDIFIHYHELGEKIDIAIMFVQLTPRASAYLCLILSYLISPTFLVTTKSQEINKLGEETEQRPCPGEKW